MESWPGDVVTGRRRRWFNKYLVFVALVYYLLLCLLTCKYIFNVPPGDQYSHSSSSYILLFTHFL